MFKTLGFIQSGFNNIGFIKEDVGGISAPENLATSGISSTAITLSWDAVTGADHYEVYLDGSLVDDAVATESYEFTGLDSDTEYVLGVKAVDGDDNKSSLSTTTVSTLPISVGDALLLESGSYLLLENGDKLLLE